MTIAVGSAYEMPRFEILGNDLLQVGPVRRAVSLATPFVLVVAFFVLSAHHWWAGSVACTMLLTFLTYGSISHDLVHRTLRLPIAVNETLLCLIELVCFRSGHAYRTTHLHHHAHFPSADDIEGAAAAMTWWRALLDGLTLQPRLWAFAFRRRRDRLWMASEAVCVITLLVGSTLAIRWTVIFALYGALMIAGSWTFPFITSYIPHDAKGQTELAQTRVFRGAVIALVALQHLYHLEHHLYPRVPHQNWPELARRLDPYFARAGLRPNKVLF